jgi:hypothetical protein
MTISASPTKKVMGTTEDEILSISLHAIQTRLPRLSKIILRRHCQIDRELVAVCRVLAHGRWIKYQPMSDQLGGSGTHDNHHFSWASPKNNSPGRFANVNAT